MATAEPEEMNVKFFVTGVGGQLGHDVMNELGMKVSARTFRRLTAAS